MSIGNLPNEPSLSPSMLGWLDRAKQELNKLRRPLYIPVTQFSGYQRIVDATDATEDVRFRFAGAGNPVLDEVNSLGIIGARIEAVDDACHHLFYVPKDFNVNSNIKIEVAWCTDSSDTSETATWKVQYKSIAAGETLSAVDTELNSLITADNVLGTYKYSVSPYGLIYKDVLEHGDLLHLKISLGAVSGLAPASDIIFLLGILINDEG